MYFVREINKPVNAQLSTALDYRIFEFCKKREDYFLTTFVNWEKRDVDMYRFKLGSSFIDLPSDFYVYIGSAEGVFDWVLVDSLVEHQADVVVMPFEMNSWSLETAELTGTYTSNVYYPVTNNIIPITNLDGTKHLLLSSVDPYHKFKNKPFDLFFS